MCRTRKDYCGVRDCVKYAPSEHIRYHSKQLAKDNDGNGEDTMRAIPLRFVKKGDAFKTKPTDSAPVWIKDDYDRSSKKYCCYSYANVNRCRELKASTVVYVDFYF